MEQENIKLMQDVIKQPKWTVVEYTKSQIIKAGRTIRHEESTDEQKAYAVKVIDNWRAAHAFPLHVLYMHLRRMAANHSEIIVAERLKRLDSILNKLKREKTMSLWTMQDLGGCRFIVPTIEDVYLYADRYEKSRKRHELKNTYDYIKEPKLSGYRSLHKVYEYHSDKTETYNNNMLIELQFRTHLQHLWATAVETMGVFTKEDIKSGQGSADVNRFFMLVSSLFAIREGQPVVPGMSNSIADLVSELKTLNDNNHYLKLLSGIKVGIKFQQRQKNKIPPNTAYYMLILNYETRRLSVQYFMSSEIERANQVYNFVENSKKDAQIDVVLVRVRSVDMLKKAYPNYFSDLSEFTYIVNKYLQQE